MHPAPFLESRFGRRDLACQKTRTQSWLRREQRRNGKLQHDC